MELYQTGPGPALVRPADRLARRREPAACKHAAILLGFLLGSAAVVLAGVAAGASTSVSLPTYRLTISWLCTWAMVVTLIDPFLIRYRSLGQILPLHEDTVRAGLLTWATRRTPSVYLAIAALAFLCSANETLWSALFGSASAAERWVQRAASMLIGALVYVGLLSFAAWMARDAPDVYLQTTGKDAHPTRTSARVTARFAGQGPSLGLGPLVVAPGTLQWHPEGPEAGAGPRASTEGDHASACCPSISRGAMLAALVAAVLAVAAVQTAYTALLGSEPWLLLAAIAGFALVSGLVIWSQWRWQWSHVPRARLYRAFFQLFLLLSTLVPVLFGSWLIGAYRARRAAHARANDDVVLLLLQIAFSQTHFWLTYAAVSRLAAPYTYARLLFLPQLTGLFTQHALFGLLPWSGSFTALAIAASAHNVLASADVYWRLLSRLLQLRNAQQETGPARAVAKLLSTGFSMRLFSQECLCDLLSLFVLSLLVYVAPWTGWASASLLPAFARPYLALRFGVLLLTRCAGWLVSQWLFTRRLDALRDRLGAEPVDVEAFVAAQGAGSDADRAEIRSTLEHEMPELFVARAAHDTPTRDARDTPTRDARDTRPAAHQVVRELVEWRNASLDARELGKNAAYFFACFLLLAFIVLQRDAALPLRLAWYAGET